MKFKLILLAIVLAAALGSSSCATGTNNVDVGKHAIVSLPNGEVIEGEIESLTRWTSSMNEITIDGITYCVHPLCIAVVGEGTE
jgi:hypothetical protein